MSRDNSYLKYTNIAIQMGVTIGLGVFLGQWLDKRMGTDNHLWTAICSLVFVVAAIYLAVKDFLKPDKEK